MSEARLDVTQGVRLKASWRRATYAEPMASSESIGEIAEIRQTAESVGYPARSGNRQPGCTPANTPYMRQQSPTTDRFFTAEVGR